MRKINRKTSKRGKGYETELRIEAVYLDLYGHVSDVIAEFTDVVNMFPEEMRSEVMVDVEESSGTFWVKVPASKEDAEIAMAKDRKEKEDWLARAVKQRAQLDAQIAKVSKEV
jgi:hypothetical protein